MDRLERDIGNTVSERIHDEPEAAKAPLPLLRRCEDFAVDNMKGLAVGASAAIVMLASAIVLQDAGGRTLTADPAHVGSVTIPSAGPARVPSLPDWQVVRKPAEVMALQAPQFERVTPHYAQRRNSQNDREDSLTWPQVAAGSAEARVAVIRRAAPAGAPSLFIEMTRQQAERGIAVSRAGLPGPLVTKFGTLEVADMSFQDAGGAAQACLGFRGPADSANISLSGWYCAAEGMAVTRPEVACFIDRLNLLKSGEDQGLRRFFTEAEQRRRPCPTARASAGRKPTWLDDDGSTPAMRGAGEETTGSITRPKR